MYRALFTGIFFLIFKFIFYSRNCKKTEYLLVYTPRYYFHVFILCCSISLSYLYVVCWFCWRRKPSPIQMIHLIQKTLSNTNFNLSPKVFNVTRLYILHYIFLGDLEYVTSVKDGLWQRNGLVLDLD